MGVCSHLSHSLAHSALLRHLFLLFQWLWQVEHLYPSAWQTPVSTPIQYPLGQSPFSSLPLIISVTCGSAWWSCTCHMVYSHAVNPELTGYCLFCQERTALTSHFPVGWLATGYRFGWWMLGWWLMFLVSVPHWAPGFCCRVLSFEHWAGGIKARQPTV